MPYADRTIAAQRSRWWYERHRDYHKARVLERYHAAKLEKADSKRGVSVVEMFKQAHNKYMLLKEDETRQGSDRQS
jgi:hypothetical protein